MFNGQIMLGLLLDLGHAHQVGAGTLIGPEQAAIRRLCQALSEGVGSGLRHASPYSLSRSISRLLGPSGRRRSAISAGQRLRERRLAMA